MNERVANLEMNSTKELGFTSRKFNTLQNEI